MTKIKEKLENYLSQINNELKKNEKICKGIKSLKKEESNIIKIISYFSTVNKNKKSFNKLFKAYIKSISFSYIEKECNIKYEENIFNGIPIPINILVDNITFTTLDISWNISEIKNSIKYKIEMSEDNKNFKEVYEGPSRKFYLIDLYPDTNYEFRICSILDNQESDWSETVKVKTKNLDSTILQNEPNKKKFIKKMIEWTDSKNLELLFRSSRDGVKSEQFHSLCDNKGPTISLFKNEKGNIFGGYSFISWTSDLGSKSDNDSFLFTFTNKFGIGPLKFPNKKKEKGIIHDIKYGPSFGSRGYLSNRFDICIENDSCFSDFPNFYEDTLKKGYIIFTGNKEHNCKLKEYEVFKVNS